MKMAKLFLVKTESGKVKYLSIEQVVEAIPDDPLKPTKLDLTFTNNAKETIKINVEEDDPKLLSMLNNDAMATAIIGRFVSIIRNEEGKPFGHKEENPSE